LTSIIFENRYYLVGEKHKVNRGGKNNLTGKQGKNIEKQDYVEAVKWLRKSAEQGNADAQASLGAIYLFGKGVEQDYVEAVKWLRKSAEQGNADAQYNLGMAYDLGKGVEQDYVEAVKWYRRSAEQGDADAQYNLGEIYLFGKGVEQDYVEAVKWYRRSAEQGNADAQYNLGVFYAKGEGVPKSDKMAADCFYQAGLSYLKKDRKDDALMCVDMIKYLNIPTASLANKLFDAIYEGEEGLE
jgi:TPR repeat protein